MDPRGPPLPELRELPRRPGAAEDTVDELVRTFVTGYLAHHGPRGGKVHCSSDADSSAGLVDVQVEDAIHDAVHAQREAFVEDLVVQARRDADRCRTDHELFVDAFRRGLVGGIDPT